MVLSWPAVVSSILSAVLLLSQVVPVHYVNTDVILI